MKKLLVLVLSFTLVSCYANAATTNPMTGSKVVATGTTTGRTLETRFADVLEAADFGVVADDATDNTTALQAAMTAAVAAKKALLLPGGVTRGCITNITSNFTLMGQGPSASTLKMPNTANCVGVVATNNVASLWLSGSSGGSGAVYFSNMTIDGNRANNTTGNCVSLYGWRPTLENVVIQNCPVYGVRTDWGGPDSVTAGMEGKFSHLVIDSVGQHGWRYDGPHDSQFQDVIIIDPSLSAAHTYDGMITTTNFSLTQVHIWSRSNTCRYAFNDDGNDFTNTYNGVFFECGFLASMRWTSANSNMDAASRVRIPDPEPTAAILLLGSGNIIRGEVACNDQPTQVGVQVGALGNTQIDNNISVNSVGCSKAVVDLTYTGGQNRAEATNFGNSTPYIFGTPDSTDYVSITGGDGLYEYDQFHVFDSAKNSVYVGEGSGKLVTSASENACYGNFSCEGLTSGSFNTAGGQGALGSLTTSDNNTAYGYHASTSLTTGQGVTSLGTLAAGDNATGSYITALGYGACGATDATDGTTCVGFQSFLNATVAQENTGVGVNTGVGCTNCSFNAFFGHSAGAGVTTGDNNVLLGYQACDGVTTGSSNICIGPSVDVPSATGTNQFIVGNSTDRLMQGSTATGTQWLAVENHLETSGIVPTVGTGAGDCGTSPSVNTNASDTAGTITVGSSTNGGHCTLTFHTAWSEAPKCFANNDTSAARPVYAIGASTSSVVITSATTLTAADKLSYFCIGNRS